MAATLAELEQSLCELHGMVTELSELLKTLAQHVLSIMEGPNLITAPQKMVGQVAKSGGRNCY